MAESSSRAGCFQTTGPRSPRLPSTSGITEAAFSRAFKALVGMSPAGRRRRQVPHCAAFDQTPDLHGADVDDLAFTEFVMSAIFISHSSQDVGIAVEIQDWLVAQGHEVFWTTTRRMEYRPGVTGRRNSTPSCAPVE